MEGDSFTICPYFFVSNIEDSFQDQAFDICSCGVAIQLSTIVYTVEETIVFVSWLGKARLVMSGGIP